MWRFVLCIILTIFARLTYAQEGLDACLNEEYENCVYVSDSYSDIQINPVTGLIDVYGFTEVETYSSDPNDPWGDPTSSYQASTDIQLYPSNITGHADNNCGVGCAELDVFSQVTALDTPYNEWTGHNAYGNGYLVEGDCSCYDSITTEDGYYVPQAPTLQLTIDASNLNNVVFTYSRVSGPALVGANIQVGSNPPLYSNIDPPTFNLDQNAFPVGTTTATITGYMYGLAVNYTTSCDINVVEGIGSSQDSSGFNLQTGGDGIAFQIVPVGHAAHDWTRSVSYCNGYAEDGVRTRLDASVGSITLPNAGSDSIAIYLVTETHDYPNSTDSMPPVTYETVPPQGGYLQSREADYSNRWLASSTPAEVCNNQLLLTDGTQIVYTGSLGCLSWFLP